VASQADSLVLCRGQDVRPAEPGSVVVIKAALRAAPAAPHVLAALRAAPRHTLAVRSYDERLPGPTVLPPDQDAPQPRATYANRGMLSKCSKGTRCHLTKVDPRRTS
jgi:hypothetical protein